MWCAVCELKGLKNFVWLTRSVPRLKVVAGKKWRYEVVVFVKEESVDETIVHSVVISLELLSVCLVCAGC